MRCRRGQPDDDPQRMNSFSTLQAQHRPGRDSGVVRSIWSLKGWAIALSSAMGIPLLVVLLYVWADDPRGVLAWILGVCSVAMALGCAGVYVFIVSLGEDLRAVATPGVPSAVRKHRVREIAELVAGLDAAAQTLRAVHASHMQAEDAERRRLARELHDELGQELALLHMWMQSLQSEDTEPGTQARVLRDAEALAGTLMERVRSMALDLRPAQLDDLGLAAALRALSRRVTRQTGIAVTLLDVPEAVQRVSEPIETALFRVAQAAVTNAVRHARATTLWIALEVEDGIGTVKVQDDGCGFDLDRVRSRAAAGSGLGLIGMQERVEALGGTMKTISAPGAGTLIAASIPIGAVEPQR